MHYGLARQQGYRLGDIFWKWIRKGEPTDKKGKEHDYLGMVIDYSQKW